MSKTPEAKQRDPSLAYAKLAGIFHKRMHFGHGAASGWPDDLFVIGHGHHWWVEFKKLGGEATALQEETHTKMLEQGCDVSVIDSFELFKHELEQRVEKHNPSMIIFG